MKKENLNFMKAVLVLLACVMLLTPVLDAAETQEADAKAYKQAYRLIGEAKWDQASKALEAFARTYSKSSYVDDAKYWRCYASEKLETSLENVFDCYEKQGDLC